MAVHLKQPRGSKLCGQSCVAMLTGLDRLHVRKRLGNKGTKTRDIVATLTALGYSVPDRLIPRRGRPIPRNALCKIPNRRRGSWHWVCKVDGRWHDPLRDKPGGVDVSRITSYLPVEPMADTRFEDTNQGR